MDAGIGIICAWLRPQAGFQPASHLDACQSSLFIVWLFTFSQYDPGRYNKITLWVATGLVAALLIFFYWQQEVARQKA